MSLRSTLRALDQAGINCVVIGGVAATVHGSAHITNDVDICYDTEPGNIDKLVKLLLGLKAELRSKEETLPFTIDRRTFRDSPFLTLSTTEGDLDLLDIVPGVGKYADVLAASELVDWDGVKFHVLSLPSLIAAKRAAGRKKDRDQLIELEAIRAMNKSPRSQELPGLK